MTGVGDYVLRGGDLREDPGLAGEMRSLRWLENISVRAGGGGWGEGDIYLDCNCDLVQDQLQKMNVCLY